MAHTLTRSLSATAAISAVLALGSTPSFAQEAAPVIQLQPPVTTTAQPVAAPATAPAVVIPEVSTAQTSPSTDMASVAAAEPAPAATQTRAERSPRTQAPRRAAATTASEASTPQRQAATEPQRSAPAPQPVASTAAPARPSSANILNDNPTTPVGQSQPAPAARPAAPAGNDGIPGEAIAGILAVLGIGAVGYAAMASRRRRAESGEVEYADTPLEPQGAQPQPVVAAPVASRLDTQPALQVHYGFRPATGAQADAELIERAPVNIAPPLAPQAQRSRDSVAMPTQAPATADEREAWLDRMVEAEPDEANPFVSRKARRKRARLLLQQSEHQSHGDAPFDWRTYKSESRRSTPADPELVTA